MLEGKNGERKESEEVKEAMRVYCSRGKRSNDSVL